MKRVRDGMMAFLRSTGDQRAARNLGACCTTIGRVRPMQVGADEKVKNCR